MTWRLAATETWLKAELVGEKAFRDELSRELLGLVCPAPAVAIGGSPGRGGCLLFVPAQAAPSARWLREGFAVLLLKGGS